METIRSEERFVRAGEKRIYGRAFLPEGPGKHPAVILSHGYNGCHADFERECRFFARQGILAYAFDFCGGSTRSKSTGASTNMTLFTEKQDLLDVFDALCAWEEADSERICLLGGSQGGLVTALAAEEIGNRARCMILYFPAFNIPEDWRHRFDEGGIPEEVPFWGLTLGRGFFESMKTLDPFERIGGYGNPVLILQGDRDEIVRPAIAERAVRRYPRGEMRLLPGEGHGFSPAGTDAALKEALSLLERAEFGIL